MKKIAVSYFEKEQPCQADESYVDHSEAETDGTQVKAVQRKVTGKHGLIRVILEFGARQQAGDEGGRVVNLQLRIKCNAIISLIKIYDHTFI